MEMGKLTAKLRDAVPVCLLVEGKEVMRCKNIEIPDELKKLEYQDFKFDVSLNGAITFKIMFESGILPEEFPQVRERRTRIPMEHRMEPQESAPVAEVDKALQPQDEQVPETLPVLVAEAFAQALEDEQTAGKTMAEIVEAMSDDMIIKTENIDGESEGQLVFITVEQAAMGEVNTQSEDNKPAIKPACKGKGEKNAAAADGEGK
jgi:hypothetical protein